MRLQGFRLLAPFAAAVAALLLASPARAQCEALAGGYYGHWSNDTFASLGPAVFTIEIVGSTASFEVDMGGLVFGLVDPVPVPFSGTVGSDAITVNATGLMTYGDLAGTIDCATGAIDFTLSMIPDVSFDDVAVTGSVANDAFDVSYEITSMSMFFAGGRMVATLPGDPASDFEAGDELWTALPAGAAMSGQVASGGNPGGFLQIEDQQSGSFAAVAPGTFLADLGAFDGGTLRFDAKAVPTDGSSPDPSFATVQITGTTAADFATLDFDQDVLPPPDTWMTYEMPFTAEAWGVSQADWEAILADARFLAITLGSTMGANDSAGLDNVVLASEPGEVGAAAAAMAALVVLRRLRVRRGP